MWLGSLNLLILIIIKKKKMRDERLQYGGQGIKWLKGPACLAVGDLLVM